MKQLKSKSGMRLRGRIFPWRALREKLKVGSTGAPTGGSTGSPTGGDFDNFKMR
jgi:hypothetical protein